MIPGIESQQVVQAGDGRRFLAGLGLGEVASKQEAQGRAVVRQVPGQGPGVLVRQHPGPDQLGTLQQGYQESARDPGEGAVGMYIDGGDQVVEDVQTIRRLRVPVEKGQPVVFLCLPLLPGVGRGGARHELRAAGFGGGEAAVPLGLQRRQVVGWEQAHLAARLGGGVGVARRVPLQGRGGGRMRVIPSFQDGGLQVIRRGRALGGRPGPVAQVHEAGIDDGRLAGHERILGIAAGLLQEVENPGVLLPRTAQFVAPEEGAIPGQVVLVLGGQQGDLQQGGTRIIRGLALGLGEGELRLGEGALVDVDGAEALPGGGAQAATGVRPHAIQEGAFLLPVIAAVIGIAEDVEGLLAALVQPGGGGAVKEGFEQGDGAAGLVLHQPAFRRQPQQVRRHLARGQGLLEEGLAQFRQQQFPEQIGRHFGSVLDGAAAVAVAGPGAAGAGHGVIRRVQGPGTKALSRQGGGVPDGASEQEGQPPILAGAQVGLFPVEDGRQGLLGPAQEARRLLVLQDALEAQEQDLLERALVLGWRWCWRSRAEHGELPGAGG